jgi:hypothetical protein
MMRHQESSSPYISFSAGYATGYNSNGASSWLGSPLRGNTDRSYDCCPEKIPLFTWRSCRREVLRCLHVHAVGALPHSRSPRIDLLSLIESDGYYSCIECALDENSKLNAPQHSRLCFGKAMLSHIPTVFALRLALLLRPYAFLAFTTRLSCCLNPALEACWALRSLACSISVSCSSRLLHDRAGGALRKAILSLFSCMVRTARSKFDLIPDSRHSRSYIQRGISVLHNHHRYGQVRGTQWPRSSWTAATSAWNASCSPDLTHNRLRSLVIVTTWKT